METVLDAFQRYWKGQFEWSQVAFGSSSFRGPVGPLKHLRKEVGEVLAALAHPENRNNIIEELADCMILTIDAAQRAGEECLRFYSTTFYESWGSRGPILKSYAEATIPLRIVERDTDRMIYEFNRKNPFLSEYQNIGNLILDAAAIVMISPRDLVEAMNSKLLINRSRQWQPPMNPNEAVEHVRS